jgi:hypothetical protein
MGLLLQLAKIVDLVYLQQLVLLTSLLKTDAFAYTCGLAQSIPLFWKLTPMTGLLLHHPQDSVLFSCPPLHRKQQLQFLLRPLHRLYNHFQSGLSTVWLFRSHCLASLTIACYIFPAFVLVAWARNLTFVEAGDPVAKSQRMVTIGNAAPFVARFGHVRVSVTAVARAAGINMEPRGTFCPQLQQQPSRRIGQTLTKLGSGQLLTSLLSVAPSHSDGAVLTCCSWSKKPLISYQGNACLCSCVPCCNWSQKSP